MFTVYTKPNCTYCEQAKKLLESKNIPYETINVDVGQPKVEGQKYVTVQELKEAIPTAMTVPQILQEGRLIGGFRELQQFLGGGS
jgi:glutaredoxin